MVFVKIFMKTYTNIAHFLCVPVQRSNVSDPDWIRIQSAQWIRIRIRNPDLDPRGQKWLNTADPDPVLIQKPGSGSKGAKMTEYRRSGSSPDPGFWWKKIEKNLQLKIFLISLDQKLGTIYLSLDLHNGCPSYRRSIQLWKENIQHFKTFLNLFSTFVGNFIFLPVFGIRIRIRNIAQYSLSRPPHPI